MNIKDRYAKPEKRTHPRQAAEELQQSYLILRFVTELQ